MLLGEVFHTTGNDARDRSVAIAHQYFFTVTNHLDVSTKPSFQVTDVNGFHIAVIADVNSEKYLDENKTRVLRIEYE
jgi:hypothetical protein